MPYSVANLRRIRRRTRKRAIIKGQGFLDFIRRKYRQGVAKVKEWGQRKLPEIAEGIKDVGRKHWKEIKEKGIPVSRDQFVQRAKDIGRDVLSTTRSKITGSGGLKRQRFVPYNVNKRGRKY